MNTEDRVPMDAQTLAPVTLRGRRVYLRPVLPTDYEFLFAVETSGELGVFYRHRAISQQPEQYPESLWAGVLTMFLVCNTENDERLGLVTCYGANFRHQHAYLATIFRPDVWRLGWPLESLPIFINYLFAGFPFRKLYANTIDFNTKHFASGFGEFGRQLDVLKEESRLVEHEFYGGRWFDQVTLAIHRNDWDREGKARERSRLLEFLESEPVGATLGSESPNGKAQGG